jgi:predicted nuclease of predicted toxin-antitoxin system
MSQAKFLILVDENMSNAVVEQLQKRGLDAIHESDVLPTGIEFDALLEYAHQNSYSIIASDQSIAEYIQKRTEFGKEYSGVFIANKDMREEASIGRILDFIAEYDEAIKGGAARRKDDVYNQTIYIKR